MVAASAGVIAIGIGACSSSGSNSGSSGSGAGSSQTLVMESSPESTITQAFNPYLPTDAAYQMGADGLIYEPLIQFDLVAPPKYYPWLATGYTWSNGGKSITFAIRPNVKWNNGSALTPADVAFTFNLMKANASINSGGLNISSVSTSGQNVTVNFPTPQYTNLEEIAGVAVVPQSIWSKAGNPGTYADTSPVGSGPYMLGSFTPQGFTLVKNPHYWQASKVKVAKIYFPVYSSNTSALSALFSGQIAWTGNFIPGLQKQFVDKSPSYHHYWEAPGGTNSLMPNLNTWPTNQLPVRKAISLALNRSVMASEGEAGLEAPVTNTTGLTMPTFQAWGAPVSSMTMSPTANAAAAEQVLEAAGYTKGSNGFFQKGGKTVSLSITDPSAYTDYAEDDAIAAQELKAAGIDATFQGQAVSAWSTDIADGDFQLTLHWCNSGITPYNMYNGWLNSSLASGKSATGDYERLKNPAINADLATLATANTVAQQTSALVPIEKYVAANLPIIPTTTASDWFEYNSQNFTGWPTQQDPYESGQPSGSNNGPGTGSDEVVALHLTPRG
ncbi:MAG TPA: ABC transporter substrate-binding protein [Streptosporangiaceae bacterium]|jgi:peptide/nickel transport system substrate-binding protein|nr:ABC transporter substrate-binding protein [Streptosporangiaceae bacterium]